MAGVFEPAPTWIQTSAAETGLHPEEEREETPSFDSMHARQSDAGAVPDGPGTGGRNQSGPELLWVPRTPRLRRCHSRRLQRTIEAEFGPMDSRRRHQRLFRQYHARLDVE